MIAPQTWRPIQTSTWLPTALRGNWIQDLGEAVREEDNPPSPPHFAYLAHPLAEASTRRNVSPLDRKNMARKEFSLCISRTCTTTLPQKRWLLIDICMNLPHLFCIQPLIMVLSTSQSWLMVVGSREQWIQQASFCDEWERKQCKTAPTHCLQQRLLLWVPFGGFGGNQGCPGAWSFGNETAGGKFYYSDRKKVLQASSVCGGNSPEPRLSCSAEWEFRLYSHLFGAF